MKNMEFELGDSDICLQVYSTPQLRTVEDWKKGGFSQPLTEVLISEFGIKGL